MAARESTTQPIICCLGPSVAGQPTQFLLERAFEHTRLPWRALSVEFDSAKFAQVCEAMLAMGFQGLRFYGDFEQLAIQQLASTSLADQFMGQVTSAQKTADQWTIWNNRASGWLDLLELHQASAVWLHGDCAENRSLAITLLQCSLSWLWTDAPRNACENSVEDDLKPVVRTRVFEVGSRPPTEQLAELLGTQSVPHESNSTSPLATFQQRIALVSYHTSIPAEFSDWLVEQNPELIAPAQLKLPESLMANYICRVNAADLAVAAEASDFKRWTGQAIDSSVLRDAYDEFCDF